jgi:hypothetical protein
MEAHIGQIIATVGTFIEAASPYIGIGLMAVGLNGLYRAGIGKEPRRLGADFNSRDYNQKLVAFYKGYVESNTKKS